MNWSWYWFDWELKCLVDESVPFTMYGMAPFAVRCVRDKEASEGLRTVLLMAPDGAEA